MYTNIFGSNCSRISFILENLWLNFCLYDTLQAVENYHFLNCIAVLSREETWREAFHGTWNGVEVLSALMNQKVLIIFTTKVWPDNKNFSLIFHCVKISSFLKWRLFFRTCVLAERCKNFYQAYLIWFLLFTVFYRFVARNWLNLIFFFFLAVCWPHRRLTGVLLKKTNARRLLCAFGLLSFGNKVRNIFGARVEGCVHKRYKESDLGDGSENCWTARSGICDFMCVCASGVCLEGMSRSGDDK